MNPSEKPVVLDPRSLMAHGWLRGIVHAVPGVVFQDEGSGVRLRVLEDGTLEQLFPGGHPRGGAASAPYNGGRPRRYP